MRELQWKFRKFGFGTFSEGLARCRSCHAFTVTFEIAVNSQMQTSNISIKIVMKNYTQNIYVYLQFSFYMYHYSDEEIAVGISNQIYILHIYYLFTFLKCQMSN